MQQNCRCRGIVNDGFEELALALGGVSEIYEIPDEALWDLARAFDVTHDRIQARLSHTEDVFSLDGQPQTSSQHPAVSHLLQRLKKSHPVSPAEGGRE